MLGGTIGVPSGPTRADWPDLKEILAAGGVFAIVDNCKAGALLGFTSC